MGKREDNSSLVLSSPTIPFWRTALPGGPEKGKRKLEEKAASGWDVKSGKGGVQPEESNPLEPVSAQGRGGDEGGASDTQ